MFLRSSGGTGKRGTDNPTGRGFGGAVVFIMFIRAGLAPAASLGSPPFRTQLPAPDGR